MKYFGEHQSIECGGANVIAKKIVSSSPLNHEVFGKCLKYICTRDGEAEIVKELNPKKTQLTHPVSALNHGDKIVANSFYVLEKGLKARRLVKVKFSGAHNANKIITENYTFAEITKPYPISTKIENRIPLDFISPFKQLAK